MNIKLDNKEVRVRLSQEDAQFLFSKKYLSQQFKFGNKKLTLDMKIDPTSAQSCIVNENDILVIALDAEASRRLQDNTIGRSGIAIEDINIQIDSWDLENRIRHDENKKKRQS